MMSKTQIADSILDLVGGTPVVRLNRVVPKGAAEVVAKAEFFNPGASVKDRICLNIIQTAEASGQLKPGGTVIEGTSGNTGIGLAMVCAVKGYHLIITMPESMSKERRTILKRFGAELILTPASEGMTGAVKKAEEILKDTPGAVMARQFDNPANPDAHRKTTAQEILEQVGTDLDAVVIGVGTGGTITGVGEVLSQKIPDIKLYAVEPVSSPVLSGGSPGPHTIQGIGAGFVPGVLNTDVFKGVITVKDEDAYKMTSRLCSEEGLLVGVSSGANVVAAIQVAEELGSGKRVLTMLNDTGERYISLDGLDR